MNDGGRLGPWTDRGLRAGAMIGAFEAAERTWAVREFLRGPGEGLAFALLAFSFCLLTGVAIGVLAAAVAAGMAAGRRLPIPAWTGRVLAGAGIGAAAAAWMLFAMTLTVRFDSILARASWLIAFGGVAGAVAALPWPVLHSAWQRLRGPGLAATLAALATFAVLLHLWSAHFAPQSSLGIHLLADTTLFALALVLAGRLPPWGGRRLAAALAAAALLVAWTDAAMRRRPVLENLIKTRGAVSAHAIRLWSEAMDADHDGHAPGFLVGGDDPANFDSRRPAPLLGDLAAAAPNGGPAALPAALPPPYSGRPHLVLLTLDACRADVVPPVTPERSRLGALQPPTPNLEALSGRVARFIAGYTPSAGTEDTFAALFSGWDLPGVLRGVPEERRLSARLAAAGYEVHGFVNDPHFTVSTFESARLRRFQTGDAFRMVESAAAFLDSLPADRPGFVWIHVMDMHADLLRPFARETFSHRAHLEFYARGLSRVDSVVGDFVAALDSSGLTRRTLLVLSADHGEELGGHGHYHHNLSLYQPAIRVPLWVMGPGVLPGHRAARVATMGIYPTLLEAAGVAPGPGPGESLWPILSGDRPASSDPLIYTFLPHRGFSRRYSRHRPELGQAAVLDAIRRHKVILRIGLESWEAYDVATDSMERWNLAGGTLAWPDSLRRQLERMVRERSLPPPAPPAAGPAGVRLPAGRSLVAVTELVAAPRHSARVKAASSAPPLPVSARSAIPWPDGDPGGNDSPRAASNLRESPQ